MRLKEGNRERLLNGVDNLNGQGNQIDRIKGVAVETHEVMIDANRELKDQGHIIGSASVKVNEADASTTRTKKRVVQMTRKEYWYKFLLYVLIVLLFCADIGSLVYKFS
jgi:predicted phosphatase